METGLNAFSFMNETEYFNIIDYILVANSVWVLGFCGLCIIWTTIARTPAKKVIFSVFAGMLLSFVVFRVFVALLPTNLDLLVLIGVIHGLMLAVQFVIFAMVTVIVKKRQKELEQAEKSREEACAKDAVQRWQPVEDLILDIGREMKWL